MTTILEGAIHTIFPVEYKKRVFWLKQINVQYPNMWQLELEHDDISLLDKFKEADVVQCEVEIRGRHWDKNGRQGVMNILKCNDIKKI